MPAQHDFLPAVTHDKPTEHSAGTKLIGSRQGVTLCQDCQGAVLLIGIVCAGAILSFGGMGSTLLLVPDYRAVVRASLAQAADAVEPFLAALAEDASVVG
eukprot:COSAG04_NODE_9879_length_824_cov_1.144828_1_plen_99_part_01